MSAGDRADLVAFHSYVKISEVLILIIYSTLVIFFVIFDNAFFLVKFETNQYKLLVLIQYIKSLFFANNLD